MLQLQQQQNMHIEQHDPALADPALQAQLEEQLAYQQMQGYAEGEDDDGEGDYGEDDDLAIENDYGGEDDEAALLMYQ